MKTIKARFDIKDLLPIGLLLVVFGIAVTYGLNILEDTEASIAGDNCAGYYNPASNVCQVSAGNTTKLSNNDFATNATVDATSGVAKLPEKLPLIVTVIVAAVIIGVLVRYLMVRFS